MTKGFNRIFLEKKLSNPLPPLPEDERIYFNVDYNTREFAKAVHCGFDDEKKLWFTGPRNTFLKQLIDLYGIHEATSEIALNLMKTQLDASQNGSEVNTSERI